MTDAGQNKFRLAQFLEGHSELFTLLGVFGAISIYLAQFPVDATNRWQNVGLVSSLLIFIVVSISIRNELKRELDSSIFDFIVKPRRESFGVLSFVVPFYLLIFSVLTIVLQYPFAGTLVVQSILFFVGISTVLWPISNAEVWFGFDENLGVIGKDEQVARFSVFIFGVATVGVAVSMIGLVHLHTEYGYGFDAIVGLQPGPGVVPFLFAFLGGVLFGALFYMLIAVLLLILHKLIQYIYRTEYTEEIFRMYQIMFGIGNKSSRQTELSEFEKDTSKEK